MKRKRLIGILFLAVSFVSNAQSSIHLTLSAVVDTLSLKAPEALIQHLAFENELLQFENYKKGFLPSVSFSLSPFSFNRSIVKLQQATDGQYNYVEDYASNSSASLSVTQKIPFTGGTLSASSNLNYMNELSRKRHSFSATPFAFSYSQQLFGSGKTMRMEKTIEYKRHEENIKKYCKTVTGIQQKALNLFMATFLASLEKQLAQANRLATDSLLNLAKAKHANKRMTEADFKQMELQAVNNEYIEEQAKKNREDAVQTLITFLGLKDNVTAVEIEAPVFTLPVSLNPETVRYYIDKNNPAMLSREIRRLEAQKTLYTSELGRKFNANINLNYGTNKYAPNFSDLYSHPSQQQSVSVGLSIPFSMWGINRNTARMAKNTYRSSMISIEKEIDEFSNQINRTVNNYNHSVNLWFIAERSYQLAQEQYNLTVQEYVMGRATAYELIASQQEQSSAMQKYYDAISNAYENYFKIRELTLYDFEKNEEVIQPKVFFRREAIEN